MGYISRALLLLVSVVFSAMPTIAANSVSARQIDAIFSQLSSNDTPGAAVLVIKDGRRVFQRGYGVAELRSRRPITSQTNFRLASVTKQFTAMAVMLLVHDGKLQYEDRLTHIFPNFPEYGSTITVRHLLTHSSGLPDYEDLWAARYSGIPEEQIPQIRDAEVLEVLSKQKTGKFVPGSKWDYSNSGYAVLAMIVEKISGEPFGKFLHGRIFAPLKMNNTVAYEKRKNQVHARAYGHTKQDSGWEETDQSPTSAVLGDGGIYSSLDDLARWDLALEHHMLLSETEMRPALTLMQLPETGNHGPDRLPVEYGFGWFLNPYKGHARMYHHGETVGFRNTIQRFTNERLTIVVLSNRADLDATSMALRVADLYFEDAARQNDSTSAAQDSGSGSMR